MRNQGSISLTRQLKFELGTIRETMGSPARERQGRKAKLSKENCLHEAQHYGFKIAGLFSLRICKKSRQECKIRQTNLARMEKVHCILQMKHSGRAFGHQFVEEIKPTKPQHMKKIYAAVSSLLSWFTRGLFNIYVHPEG